MMTTLVFFLDSDVYSSDLLSFFGRGYFFGGGCCRAGLVDILYCNEMALLYVCMLPVMTIILMLEFYTLADHTISLTPPAGNHQSSLGPDRGGFLVPCPSRACPSRAWIIALDGKRSVSP